MAEAKGLLLRADEIRAKSLTFSHPWNDKSALHGFMLARATGMKRTGVSLARLAPGKESFVYHLHHFEEEWLYVLSGRRVAEIDGEEVGDRRRREAHEGVRRQNGVEVYDLAAGKPFGFAGG